jgi:4-hydroxyacetophenone monooxygenase
VRFARPPDPIADDDEAIRDALRHARVVPLLAAVAHATGDLSILRDELRPDPARLVEPDGGVDPEQAATARELALEALARFRDGGSRPAPAPDLGTLRRILGFMVGEDAIDDYMPLFQEELAVDGEDRRAPDWTKAELNPTAGAGVGVPRLLSPARSGPVSRSRRARRRGSRPWPGRPSTPAGPTARSRSAGPTPPPPASR